MKKIFSLLLVGIMFFLTACSSSYTTIDSNKAMELINNNDVILIDVREADEYKDGHIKGAINIPLEEIVNIDYPFDTSIILYCASSMRSIEAAKTLSDLGYTSLYNLDGGLLNWGFELEE